MTRWTFRIVLCLLLGVVTTVGVAWGLAWYYFQNHDHGWTTEVVFWSDGAATQRAGVTHRFGEQRVHYHGTSELPVDELVAEWGGPSLTDSLPGWSRLESLRRDGTAVVRSLPDQEIALGLPFLSGQYQLLERVKQKYRNPPVTMTEPAEYLNGLGFEQTGPSGTFIYGARPLQPIWLGLIANSLIYATVWFAMFFGPGHARRTIRRRRGRCAKCGYDLRSGFAGEERGCPECGWGRE